MKIKFTEINSGYEGERKVSRFSPQTRSKAIIVGVLAAVFVFVYILSSVGVIPLSALFLKAKVAVSGDDERFPVAVNTESVLNSDIIGKNVRKTLLFIHLMAKRFFHSLTFMQSRVFL